MQALKRVSVNGWNLDVGDEEDARVLDVDVAESAGLARPRDVRRIIASNWDELSAHGEIRVCALGAQNTRGRPGVEYWLNEAQATALVAFLKTKKAKALRITLVKLFVAYRKGLQPSLPPPPPPETVIADPVRIGDDPRARLDVARWSAAASKVAGLSIQRVHGHLRRVSSTCGARIDPTR